MKSVVFSSLTGMKKQRRALSFQVESSDTERIDSDSERPSEDSPLKVHLKRRLRLTPADETSLSTGPNVTVVERLTRRQKWIYIGIALSLFIHSIFSFIALLRLPPAAFLMVFHGIVSPSTLILYIVGVLSATYGYVSLFSKSGTMREERRASCFRYYLRANKLILLVWILASQGTAFGCWKFVFAQNMDKQFPFDKLVGMAHMDTIVRLTITSMPHLLDDLTSEHGITANTSPLNLVGIVGQHYIVFILIFTVIPVALMFWAIITQRKYYAVRFMSNN